MLLPATLLLLTVLAIPVYKKDYKTIYWTGAAIALGFIMHPLLQVCVLVVQVLGLCIVLVCECLWGNGVHLAPAAAGVNTCVRVDRSESPSHCLRLSASRV